jgi:hypothetical protein
MFCQFNYINDSTYKCINCDNSVYVEDSHDEPPVVVCRAFLASQNANKNNISFADKIKNFTSSLYGHIKNNLELCPDKVIEERYQTCKACEFFENSTCSKCGCPLYRDRIYISKLAWANEQCPINKWQKFTD